MVSFFLGSTRKLGSVVSNKSPLEKNKFMIISHWLQEVVSVLLIGQGEIFLLPAGNAGCNEWYVPESFLFILSEGCFFF